jgi:hypothetical protein
VGELPASSVFRNKKGKAMNGNTLIRIRTIFGTANGNQEINDRHIALSEIPGELTRQAHRYGLDTEIKVVKLTIAPEVEQPPADEEEGEHEAYPVYGVPDLSRFYDEL